MTFEDKMKSPLVPRMAELLGTTVEELTYTLRCTYDLSKPSHNPNYLKNLLFPEQQKATGGRAMMANCTEVLRKHPEVVDLQSFKQSRLAMLTELGVMSQGRDYASELFEQWVTISPGATKEIAEVVITNNRPINGNDFMRRMPELLTACEELLLSE